MYPAANLTAGNASPSATVALGQTNFSAGTQSNASQTNKNFLAYPTSVAVDTNGNIYVTDSYARALVYPGPGTLGETASTITWAFRPRPPKVRPSPIRPSPAWARLLAPPIPARNASSLRTTQAARTFSSAIPRKTAWSAMTRW